jgi:hypothetical protein
MKLCIEVTQKLYILYKRWKENSLKFLLRSANHNYCTTYVLWRPLLSVHGTSKRRELSDDETTGATYLTTFIWNGLRVFQSKRKCPPPTWHSLERRLRCWHRPLSRLLQVLLQELQYSWEGMHKRASSVVATRQNLLELDPATEKAIQSPLDVRSTTAGHIPCRVSEFRRTETGISASQPDVHLPAATVGEFTDT